MIPMRNLLQAASATVMLGTVTAAVALSAAPALPTTAEPSRAWAAYEGTVLDALASLPVKAERREGYDRDLFPHWSSQGDNCSTRDVVLIDESTDPATAPDAECDYSGSWFSVYDGETTTDPSTFDIDHRVALAEAWDSGAWRWDTDTRERFANDLGDSRSLIAVTASSNRSKGDREPHDWMPDRAKCTYLVRWVVVKVRWRLAVNRGEKRFIRNEMAALDCANRTITVRRATITSASAG